jgi:hypothetical protein
MFLLGRAVLQTASGSDLIFPLSTLYACPRCMDTYWIWSGIRESNASPDLGKVRCYRHTHTAQDCRSSACRRNEHGRVSFTLRPASACIVEGR